MKRDASSVRIMPADLPSVNEHISYKRELTPTPIYYLVNVITKIGMGISSCKQFMKR